MCRNVILNNLLTFLNISFVIDLTDVLPTLTDSLGNQILKDIKKTKHKAHIPLIQKHQLKESS